MREGNTIQDALQANYKKYTAAFEVKSFTIVGKCNANPVNYYTIYEHITHS